MDLDSLPLVMKTRFIIVERVHLNGKNDRKILLKDGTTDYGPEEDAIRFFVEFDAALDVAINLQVKRDIAIFSGPKPPIYSVINYDAALLADTIEHREAEAV